MPTRNINSDLKVNANLTLPSLPTYSGSDVTALMIAGADVVGKRALGTNAFNSTSYLPLAGGTLTGGLYGTTAAFSGNVGITGTGNLIKKVEYIDEYKNATFIISSDHGHGLNETKHNDPADLNITPASVTIYLTTPAGSPFKSGLSC